MSERSASGEHFFGGGGGGGGPRTKKCDNPLLASLQHEHGFSRIFKASSSQSMLQDVGLYGNSSYRNGRFFVTATNSEGGFRPKGLHSCNLERRSSVLNGRVQYKITE